MEKRSELRVGFTARDMGEAERIAGLGLCDFAEVSLGGFARSGLPLFLEEKAKIELNPKFCKTVSKFAHREGLDINLHDSLANDGGCCLLKEEATIEKIHLLETLLNEWQIGKTFVVHPPVLNYRGMCLSPGTAGLIVANNFWQMINRIRKKINAKVKIGVENQPAKSNGGIAYLKSDPDSLEITLSKTKIGRIIDVGHIDPNVKFADYLVYDRHIMALHLHGGYDEHLPPTEENVRDYHEIIEFLKKFNPPVTLEVKKENFTDSELKKFVLDLKNIVNS